MFDQIALLLLGRHGCQYVGCPVSVLRLTKGRDILTCLQVKTLVFLMVG